ncbi:hypothetical protein BLNAU_18856 [Blattamonas nauphoetae]|uniref:Uncharacterized protein n=1 Tax=Blattamonas nauphoetae TaxID=2049346 RepID=A0ABQ9WVY0_9EUKA|nr:hypothetical protein BLNAU_22898 [Blattamonas nauphoetae]KAK2946254.1 hypothetical protein BLNAU_18856 [Blattamonas nauphoetae]
MEGTDVFMVEEGEWEEKEDGEEEARGKEQKTDGGEPEAKEDEDATAQPDEMEQNQECPSSQHTPGSSPLSTKHPLSSPIHTDTSHHTPCHSNHNVQSSPDFDAEWHSYSHNEVGVGKSDERGEKERKKVVVKFMIDSLLSFIRKEMKTRTIKLVTLNPTRIVDNAQSELIVVFFPPLCSTGLDETKRAPNAFEMSVVGFDEFSIEPLFVTAGEKSMLLNSHLKTTRMKQKVKNNELLIFHQLQDDSLSSTVSSLVCHRSTPSSIPHVDEYPLPAVYVIFSSSFVPKDMSADGYWEEDGKNTANANTLLFSSLSFAESLQITSCSFSSSMNDSILLDKLRI